MIAENFINKLIITVACLPYKFLGFSKGISWHYHVKKQSDCQISDLPVGMKSWKVYIVSMHTHL